MSSNKLGSGRTQSCGCLQNEIRIQTGKNNYVDLTGQKFGLLTALEVTSDITQSGSRI